MANKPNPAQQTTSDATTFNIEVTIPNRYHRAIDKEIQIEGPLSAKIAKVAEDSVLTLCEGGQLFQANVIKKLQDTMRGPVGPAEIIREVEKGVGRKNGKMQITVTLPDEYEGVFQQAAEFQNKTIQEVMSDAFNTVMDNGTLYDPTPYVSRVVMLNSDKADLVKLLGKDFGTGTELVGLIKQYAADHEGLFDEVSK